MLPGSLRPAAEATILNHGGARTLYRGRRPVGRSLDGVTATNGAACGDCLERKHCTPLVRLDPSLED